MKKPGMINLDGKTYTVVPYTTSVGLKLMKDLFLLIGEPIVMMVVGMKDGKKMSDLDISEDSVHKIMMGLTDRLEAKQLDELFIRVLENTMEGQSSNSVTANFETRFQGEYLHLFKLVWKTLGVQYGDFLSILGGLAGKAKAVSQVP